MSRNFTESNRLRARFNELIPGGGHTYAKGDDQFPEGMGPYIARGNGSHVWDVDGNEFIEYGSGLRAVTLGHAFEPVLAPVRAQLELGANFVRPARLELECAEQLAALIPCAESVKFCKDGSDATSGALKLARAFTGRDLVAICGSQPFFSVDDWFIGSTDMSGGIPDAIRRLTVKFTYNDPESLAALFAEHPGKIAAVILEAEKETPPAEGFLQGVRQLCDQHGAVMILDEMITGFRWHLRGAQAFHGVKPDLATFGKGLANGLSVSALTGRREIMQLGGTPQGRERVFLLSTTHGAETHGLAAAMAVLRYYQDNPVIEALWEKGQYLATCLRQAAESAGVAAQVPVLGKPCCLVFGTRDADGKPSQEFRTLLMQELIERGVLATSLVVNYSHSREDLDKTVEAFAGAFVPYRKALEQGVGRYLRGRPVKPAIRRFA